MSGSPARYAPSTLFRSDRPTDKQFDKCRSDFMTRYRSAFFAMSAVSLSVAFAAGCTDLKPVQSQLDDLKAQLNQIPPKVANADSQASAAAGSARSADSSAKQAQSTADKAKAQAQSNQQSIEAINEKIDRMFKKKLSK
jgi:uncharacterized protein HemX